MLTRLWVRLHSRFFYALTLLALLALRPIPAYAQATGQVLPYLHSDDAYDLNQGAIDCAMGATIHGSNWIVGFAAVTDYGEADVDANFIEAGWIRYGPDETTYSACRDQYCIYSAYEVDGDDYTFAVYPSARFNPGQRPWFRLAYDHNNYHWYSFYGYSSPWQLLLYTDFDEGLFPEVASGVESSELGCWISTHRHNDNSYSKHNSSSLTSWCYGGVHHYGSP